MPSGYSSGAIGSVLTPERVIPALFMPLAAKSVVMRATPPQRIFDAQVVSGVGTPTVDDLGPPHPLTHVRHAPGPTDPSRFAGAPLFLALWPVSSAFIWTQKEGTPD